MSIIGRCKIKKADFLAWKPASHLGSRNDRARTDDLFNVTEAL